ncbi:MAG TPA: helix-turn-helix domain-containing protein [Labilithrix sp.]|jgi:AcrR family transcriptional regulator
MGSDGRRQIILDCASRLFRHYGHAKTGIADIAREARVSVGSVYLEFASKEALVEELSKTAHVRVLEAMRSAAQKRAKSGLSTRLEGVLDARVDVFLAVAAEGQHACELVHCGKDAVAKAAARYREAELALFVSILEEARDAGELTSAVAPRAAAQLLQIAYLALTPPKLYELDAELARTQSQTMCRLLLVGLTPRARR